MIHPDLDYAEALGAVMGTLPHLHPDIAQGLVEQVTPRPEPKPGSQILSRLAALAVVAFLAVSTVVFGGSNTAVATPAFGETWRAQMRAMGLECSDPDPGDGAWTCTDADRDVFKVQGFHRKDADAYLVPTDEGCHNVLIFHEVEYAERFAANHPHADRAGRVVIWSPPYGPHITHSHAAPALSS